LALRRAPERALGGDGVVAHERAVGHKQAGEVLRPGPIRRRAHHHMPDLSGAQLLGLGRVPHEGICLAVDEELHGLASVLDDPGDVLLRVQADIGSHAGDEHVRARAEQGHDGHLAFEVANGAHALMAHQLEAAHVDAGQEDHGSAGIDLPHPLRGGHEPQIDLTRSDFLEAGATRYLDVLDIREPLSPEKCLGHLDRSLAEGRDLLHPEPCRLRRRLRSDPPWCQAEEPYCPYHRQPAQKASPCPVFSLLGTHGDLLSLAETMLERAWVQV
jgi:hypothetical protein